MSLPKLRVLLAAVLLVLTVAGCEFEETQSSAAQETDQDDVPRSWVQVAKMTTTESADSEPFELTGGLVKVRYNVTGDQVTEDWAIGEVTFVEAPVEPREGFYSKKSVYLDNPKKGVMRVGARRGRYEVSVELFEHYANNKAVVTVLELRED